MECPDDMEESVESSEGDFSVAILGRDETREDIEEVIAGSGRSVQLTPGEVTIIGLTDTNIETFTLTHLSLQVTGAKKIIININSESPFQDRPGRDSEKITVSHLLRLSHLSLRLYNLPNIQIQM